MSQMKKPFKIPTWVIVISFVCQAWPIGIGFIMLNLILDSARGTDVKSEYDNRSAKTKNDSTFESAFKAYQTEQTTKKGETVKKEKKKIRKRYKNGKKTVFMILAIFGAAVAGILSISAMSLLFNAGFLSRLLVAMLFWGGSGLFFFLFDKNKKKEQTYNKYLSIVGDRESINLSRLSLIADKNNRKVLQDMQQLIDEGYFGQDAYLDISTNNFLSSPSAVPDAPGEYYFGYEATKRAAEKKTEAAAGEEVSEFSEYLKKLRKADDDIDDVDVSERIFNLEKVSTSIFTYVEDHPEKKPEIRKFVNYYLPTTLKLLDSYSRIEKSGVAGKNMQTAKANIEATMDKLVKGFEEQLDHLYQAEVMDISSDIDVLEQMMEQDGLSGAEDVFGAAVAKEKKKKP